MGRQEECRTPLPSRILRIFVFFGYPPPPPPRKCLMANIYTAIMSGFSAHLFAQFLRLATDLLQRLSDGVILISADLGCC